MLTCKRTIIRSKGGILALSVFVFLLWGVFPRSAEAQLAPRPPAAPDDLRPAEATLDVLTSYDLSDRPEEWWDDLEAHIAEELRTDGALEDAMAKVIYVGTFYPDKANLDGTTGDLYNIYRFDDRRDYRIMALAALYAIGDENAMRLLADRGGPFLTHAPWESDELVRRLTAESVARYFLEGQVEVGEPVPADETAP